MSAKVPFLMKRSVTLAGHRTSVALEAIFWEELDKIAQEQEGSLAAVIANVDRERQPEQSLASALRVFVLERVRSQIN